MQPNSGKISKRRLAGLVLVAVVLAVGVSAWIATGPPHRARDPFGITLPGSGAVLGPEPILRGSVPPRRTAPVRVLVYRGRGRANPIVNASARVSSSAWTMPVRLSAGNYVLRIQQPATGGRTLSWVQHFRVAQDPVIAAAGDIACDPSSRSFHGGDGSPSGKNCQERQTSDLLVGADLSAVLTLGDEQYESAQPSAFAESFQPTWGRLGQLIHPAPGNHEYLQSSALRAYFSYFARLRRGNDSVGRASQGWYSFDVGSWHLIALNSNCHFIGGCGAGSPQLRWLEADLHAHRSACTLAYWHHPRFSSGRHGDDFAMTPIWQVLQAAGVDVVLVGHDHDYERFAPQTADGRRSYAGGIREFVVGTGGKSHDAIRSPQPNSQQRNSVTYGVLELVLHPHAYDWRFVPVHGKRYTDGGRTVCH